MEEALDLRLAPEDQVVPIFRELLALRKELDAGSRRKMEGLQKELRKLIFPSQNLKA